MPFDEPRVLATMRRPDDGAYTVVNRHETGRVDEHGRLLPTYVKVQCMHCQDPACVSACPTGALTKHESGAVRYDVSRCIGCRYCMLACPFQIPAYEYHEAVTPRVRKCTFCLDRVAEDRVQPACASICPEEAIMFGRRSDVIAEAHRRIEADPARYERRVYGETEVGGTCWLYLSGVPFEQLGFQDLPDRPMARTTEALQASLFSYLWSPIVLFGALAGIRAATANRTEDRQDDDES
jgi:Fe-S-cluster-containing dehydrogenase component